MGTLPVAGRALNALIHERVLKAGCAHEWVPKHPPRATSSRVRMMRCTKCHHEKYSGQALIEPDYSGWLPSAMLVAEHFPVWCILRDDRRSADMRYEAQLQINGTMVYAYADTTALAICRAAARALDAGE